ncbi:MAG: reverse transcriptase domain-containing protein, partial [Patescibacteria group bacterium]
MAQEQLVQEVWALTKPKGEYRARRYHAALEEIVTFTPEERYLKPFLRKKSNGGYRVIRPATRRLRIVQRALAGWLRREFPRSADYCYNGLRIKAAVQVHREARQALVVDLANAFNYVTAGKLKSWLSFWLKRRGCFISEKVLDLIVDLMTYGGVTPQGCVSTPYAFNLVFWPLDRCFLLISEKRELEYTRYSDNMCFSSAEGEINFAELEELVTLMVRGFGFLVSWSKRFDAEIVYLGLNIEDGEIGVVEEKLEEYREALRAMMECPAPGVYYHEVLGILAWLRQVY